MPENLFEHDQNLGGFYTLVYRYFPYRWENPLIAEYDLEIHKLICRDASRREILSEKTDTLYNPYDKRLRPREELFTFSSLLRPDRTIRAPLHKA